MRLKIVIVAHSVEGPRDTPIHSEPAPKVSPDVSKVRLLRSEDEKDVLTPALMVDILAAQQPTHRCV